MSHAGPRSTLLDALPWLDYAFQPAGQPVPADAAYGQQRHSAQVVLATQNLPPKSCESDGVIGENRRLLTGAVCRHTTSSGCCGACRFEGHVKRNTEQCD